MELHNGSSKGSEASIENSLYGLLHMNELINS